MTHLTHGNNNHVLVDRVGVQIPSGAWAFKFHFQSSKCVLRCPKSTTKICLRIDVQYLGNAAWYGVGVDEGPKCIWNHPSSIGWRGHLERSKIALASCGQSSLPYSSVIVTVPLHFPRQCPVTWAASRKSWGAQSSIIPLRFLHVIAPYATAVGYKRKLLVTEKPRDVCADMSPWNVVDSWASVFGYGAVVVCRVLFCWLLWKADSLCHAAIRSLLEIFVLCSSVASFIWDQSKCHLASGHMSKLCWPVSCLQAWRHLRSASGRGHLDFPRVRRELLTINGHLPTRQWLIDWLIDLSVWNSLPDYLTVYETRHTSLSTFRFSNFNLN